MKYGLRVACLAFLLCVGMAISAPAQTFTSLVSFGGSTNGAKPESTLTQGLDGNLYGLANQSTSTGEGAAFKITPTGTLTALHYFCSRTNCADGSGPLGALDLATNGNFYGTTTGGGANNNCGEVGCGTVFELSPAGTVFTLYSFSGSNGLGSSPRGGVAQGADGNFYGTTFDGGTANLGTVFQITPSGTLTTLYEFGGSDGELPFAGLIQATDGNFYGTTYAGGANNNCSGGGCGTVFKITTAGVLTVLHSFAGTDGSFPQAPLVQASNGILYGTTSYGGASTKCNLGCGTVFEITPSGSFKVLLSFNGTGGQNPLAGLVQATDGDLYGTTSPTDTDPTDCVNNSCGSIFQITPSGRLTTLHSFQGTDGSYPVGGLMQATNGTLYGTTSIGGTNTYCTFGCGTVFSLSMGLGPFVTTLPAVRNVGGRVIILGTDLTGATSVTFNGTSAAFTVVSATEITTNVPAGATTGFVQVVTPTGTLSSNVVFRVL
jgi:uncharacterized repeat protein (TIGR03803 family)